MGIKSFQGSRRQQTNATNEAPLEVGAYMTKDLVTFTAQQSVESVMLSLVKHRISGGPVLDEQGKLVGMISETDCIKQISESRYYNMPMPEITIEKYVSKNIDSIDGNMSIFDAANKFIQSGRRRFPIIEDGKLIGQISQKDVLKAAMTLKGQTWK